MLDLKRTSFQALMTHETEHVCDLPQLEPRKVGADDGDKNMDARLRRGRTVPLKHL